jgi:hypothetical protein
MRTIILALLFLVCCGPEVHTQRRTANRKAQREQAQPQPSPTVTQPSENEIDKAAKAERERYEEDRDAKEDAFREDQARQNRIITAATVGMGVIAALNFIVAIIYALFAYRTLKAVDKQATHANEQVGKMGDQLEEMRLQRTTMRRQAIAAVSEARSTRDTLTETKTLVRQNEGVLESMRKQVEIMGIAVEPRLRISNIRLENFSVGTWPIILVSIVNEGATDARGISLHIRVQSKEGGIVARKWSRAQIVSIPAHQEQIYPLEWHDPLTKEAYEAASQRLKVLITMKIGEAEESKFCYRIYRLKGPRPTGVGQFVPCDFDPGFSYVQTRESIQRMFNSANKQNSDEKDDPKTKAN